MIIHKSIKDIKKEAKKIQSYFPQFSEVDPTYAVLFSEPARIWLLENFKSIELMEEKEANYQICLVSKAYKLLQKRMDKS